MGQSPLRTGHLTALHALFALAVAVALASAPPSSAAVDWVGIEIRDRDGRIALGERVAVTGTTSPLSPGEVVTLEHARAGGSFVPVAQTAVSLAGGYRFTTRPRHTGLLRAVVGAVASESKRIVVRATLAASVRRHVLRGSRASVSGTVRPGLAGRRVAVERRTSAGWRGVSVGRTRADGRFRATWRPSRLGTFGLRARFRGDARNAGLVRPLGRLHVYRLARASWYGPGFYGRRTGCGSTIWPDTLGVAHKWLRCGTRVTFRYRGRSITVPVVDRGPYVEHRDWDLTAATRRALRFDGVRTIWSTR